jgi:septin family protein
MKRIVGLVLCLLLCGAFPAGAEEAVTSNVVSTEEVQGVQADLAADKAKIAEEKDQIKANATAAHAEEKAMREQLRAAKAAGDTAKVQELRAQLKTTHQENVGQMKQDKVELKTAKKELRTDRKEVRKGRADRNKDGKVDAAEKSKAKAKKKGWW